MVLRLEVSRKKASIQTFFVVATAINYFSHKIITLDSAQTELALERSAASFDVLGAESMGQIGYVLAQAMESAGCSAVPILTQVVVDQYSEAFKDPTKFVGPIYGSIEAQALATSLG